jgi:tRNA pseudouridine-54 N-methylase
MTDFPEMRRQEINEGNLSRDALTAVNCVRSSLFTSYGLRRDSKLLFYQAQSKKLILIEGDKLRYMGPNERSISILLSMSIKKLLSGDLEENPESSPGITIINNDIVPSIINQENSLVLYQKLEGLDLRTVKFTEGTVLVCKLNPEMNVENATDLFGTHARNMIGVKLDDEAEKAILLTNIEIDRRNAQLAGLSF